MICIAYLLLCSDVPVTAAEIVWLSQHGSDIQDALKFYLREYLRFLAQAPTCYNVLVDLPSQYRSDYDICPNPDMKCFRHTTPSGVDIQDIQNWLAMQWKAAEGKQDTVDSESLTRCRTALSLHQGKLARDKYIDITFATAPTVQTMCGQELILTFRIQEVIFSKTADSHA